MTERDITLSGVQVDLSVPFVWFCCSYGRRVAF